MVGMKIAVIGASGLIGTKLVELLTAEATRSSPRPATPEWTS